MSIIKKFFLISLFFIFLLILGGCSDKDNDKKKDVSTVNSPTSEKVNKTDSVKTTFVNGNSPSLYEEYPMNNFIGISLNLKSEHLVTNETEDGKKHYKLFGSYTNNNDVSVKVLRISPSVFNEKLEKISVDYSSHFSKDFISNNENVYFYVEFSLDKDINASVFSEISFGEPVEFYEESSPKNSSFELTMTSASDYDGIGEQQLKPLEVLVEGEIDSKQFLNKDVSLFIYFLTTDGKIIGGHSFDIENVQNEKITIKEKLDEQQIESVPSVDKVFVDVKEK